MNYLVNNEIVFHSRDRALSIAKILVEEDFVVMISTEEDLTVLNFAQTEHGNRGEVIFLSREEFETEWFDKEKNEDDE